MNWNNWKRWSCCLSLAGRTGCNLGMCTGEALWEMLQCWCYWWEGFVNYAFEMASGSMIYIPDFMMISSGIQVILRLLTEQFERLQCCYYWWDVFFKYGIEMGSGAMIHIPSFMKISSGIQNLLGSGICMQTYSYKQQGDLISLLLLYFFQSKESGLREWIISVQ
jgi:hypothetical protein